jgi:hypothetical protein
MTTPTNARQTSERERLATILGWTGAISADKAILDAIHRASELLRADEAEIAQLRAERDEAFRMSRCECGTNECCANLVKHSAELDALRAENEALRTVTDRNVHDALNAYDDATGEGWQIPCAQGMRAALESFIRSKESRRG